MFVAISIILLIFFSPSKAEPTNLTIDDVKAQLGGNPALIAEWMGNNIKKVRESGTNWAQSPEKLFKYRKGDCEDFAILAQYFIGDKYPTYLVEWRGGFNPSSKYYAKYKKVDVRHVVLAIDITPKYTNQGEWIIIDQDRVIKDATNLADIIIKNCELRRIDIREAYIVEMDRWHYKIIKQII